MTSAWTVCRIYEISLSGKRHDITHTVRQCKKWVRLSNKPQRSPPRTTFHVYIHLKVHTKAFFSERWNNLSAEVSVSISPSFPVLHPKDRWDNSKNDTAKAVTKIRWCPWSNIGQPPRFQARALQLPIMSWNHCFCHFYLPFYLHANDLISRVILTKISNPQNSGLHFRPSALFPTSLSIAHGSVLGWIPQSGAHTAWCWKGRPYITVFDFAPLSLMPT